MSRRTSIIVMAMSLLLLVAAGVVWVVQGSGDERADLMGVVLQQRAQQKVNSYFGP